MAPYEYRVKTVADPNAQQAWWFEVWTHRTESEPLESGWTLQTRVYVDGRNWEHDPRKIWHLLLRAMKV
jgi:hypothetical protein